MKKALFVFASLFLFSVNSLALSESCIKEGAEAIVSWMKKQEPTSDPQIVVDEFGNVSAITDKNSVWIDDGEQNEVYLTDILGDYLAFEDSNASGFFAVFVEEVVLSNGTLKCIVGEPYTGQND